MRKWLFLLRAFMPSWRFFDELGTDFILEARFGPQESQFGPWTPCLPPIERSFLRIFFNPSGNYLHACHNHLQHLAQDLDAVDLEQETSYRLTRNMARFQILHMHAPPTPFEYQFRIRERGADAFLISPVCEA